MSLPKEYDDLPGTVVFDFDRARQGYHLNMFCMSLMKAENRKAFKDNEAGYIEKNFPQLTAEQRESILKRQYNRMLELGGKIPPIEERTPQALSALVKSEVERWGRVVKTAGIRAD